MCFLIVMMAVERFRIISVQLAFILKRIKTGLQLEFPMSPANIDQAKLEKAS